VEALGGGAVEPSRQVGQVRKNVGRKEFLRWCRSIGPGRGHEPGRGSDGDLRVVILSHRGSVRMGVSCVAWMGLAATCNLRTRRMGTH
jgi:hypothetical protein